MSIEAPTATWESLRPFTGAVDWTDQVLLVAATGGAKSTLAATMTLPVGSLVAIDEKGSLTLPEARVVELPAWDGEDTTEYDRALARALQWREGSRRANRLILRVFYTDVENFEAHDRIFRAIFLRGGPVLVWVDEITATGATAMRAQPHLRAISARGRTKGIGLWTLTQAPFGITPTILRRNAALLIVGPSDPQDVRDIPRPGIELAATLPRKSGKFLVYRAGEAEPYRLLLPIPDILRGWRAP